MARNDKMINDLERMWKKAVWPNLSYYPGIALEGLRRTEKTSIR
jgi:hypothetical protein